MIDENYGFVYLIQLENGVVKVGKSSRPDKRMATLRKSAEVWGQPVRVMYLSEATSNPSEMEKKMITFFEDRFDRAPSGDEYFVDVPPEMVAGFIEGFELGFFPMNDIKMCETPWGPELVFHMRLWHDPGQAAPVSDWRLTGRIHKVLERAGPITFGVLRNRMRSEPELDVDLTVKRLVARGELIKIEGPRSDYYCLPGQENGYSG